MGMGAIKVIVSLVMLGIALMFMGFGILKNKKNHWIYAVARLCVVLLSAVLGVLVSGLLGGLLASVLYGVIDNAGLLDDVKEIFTEIPVFEEAIRGIIGCVIALILFLVVFFVLKAILNGIAKPIARKIILAKDAKNTAANQMMEEKASENEEMPKLKGKEKRRFKKLSLRTAKVNVFGMLGGALCCLLIWVVLFAPMVGVLTMVDDTMSLMEGMDEQEEELVLVMDIVDVAANNAGSKTVTYLGGKPIFEGLMTCRIGGPFVNLNREVEFLGSLYDGGQYG